MKFSIRFGAAPALAFALAACFFGEDGGKGGPGPREKPVLPLAAGNAWTYADSTFHDGTLAETSTHESFILATRTLEDGQAVFLLNVRNRFTGDPSPYSSLVNNVGLSNHVYGAEDKGVTARHESLHLKWPAETGERYLTRFVAVDSATASPILDTLEIEVVNADTLCRVPAGTFACVHYRGRRLDGALYADTWYAPGVGHLGSETSRLETVGDTTRVSRRVRKLTSYSLN